jgi:hypothetical protein
MANERKKPKRQKPPIQPRRSDQYGTGDVSENQQRLIGLLVLNFAKLEHNIEDAIWSFLGVSIDEGRPLTSRLNTDFKIEMLKSLAKTYLRGELLDDILECADLINGYKEDRNFVVHGSWGTLMPENVPVCASLRPQGPPGEVIAETFPEERMLAIIDGILEAIKNVRTLRDLVEKSRAQQQRTVGESSPVRD